MPLAPLLLLLSLASAADPATVVRQFLAAEAGGDTAGASRLWAEPACAFTPMQLHRIGQRCANLLAVDAEVISRDEERAVIETTETVLIAGARTQTSHSRFVLIRTADGWRIEKRDSLEALLVDSLARAPDAAERARLLASSGKLHDEAFVELGADLVKRFVNERHLDDASQFAHAIEAIAQRLSDPRSMAEATSARSLVARYREPPDLELGVALSEEAVTFAEAGGDADALARALVRLVRAREDLYGEVDPEPLERALAVADRLEDPSAAAHAATHLSRYLESQWRRREAFHYAELASRYAESSDDVSAKITAALMLGGAFLWYGDPALARRHFERARELSTAAGYTAVAASTIGSISTTVAPDEAARLIGEGLKEFSGFDAVPLLHERTAASIRAGRFDEAERDLLAAIQIENANGRTTRDHGAESFAWIRLGQGRYEEAERYAAATRDAGTDAYTFQRVEARILRCLGRNDEAIALLEADVATARLMNASIADPRSAPFGDWMNDEEELLVEMLVEQGNLVRAFEVSEATKSSLLQKALVEGGVPSATMNVADRRHEQELETRLRELNHALVAAKGDSFRLAKQIVDARADLLDFRQRALAAQASGDAGAGTMATLADLPPALDDVTILDYVQTERSVFVFVIEPKEHGRRAISAHLVPITHNALQQKIARYVSFIEQRNLRADDLGQELYDLLVAPFERVTRRARILCIIPHRALWQLPFHALGRDKHRLIDAVPVFYAPSVGVLADAELRRHPRTGAPASFLAFANPVIGAHTAALYRAFDRDAPLGAIPETEFEVRAIAKLYGQSRSRVHIGADAGEGALKREAARYDVLHIATHGLVQENAPMFSSLVLSSDSASEDGLLEAREIVGLELGAETVVLSACDTGKSGTRGSRDPVVGWSWAFLAAGCRTTVVSQWKAQSAATATLMIEFHRRLARGQSEAEALRGAQLVLRRDPRYRHPFYWAPFIVVGAP